MSDSYQKCTLKNVYEIKLLFGKLSTWFMDAPLEENCKNLNRKTAQATIPEALSATVQDSKTPEHNIKDIKSLV